MAIAPTGAIFHSLTFGSINSANYGIYITGQAVYNAPTRAVEMVDVPGRNGQIALDQGRWENIEVTYPAGCFADSESDFRDAISAFRNAVVSQIGYQRLTDTYNPNEYRMGVYMNGLEVKPSMLRAGQFDIVFNCKPQRWLTSGETAATIANSGDTITNPTQYASSPLLAVEGYGAVELNGYVVELENAVMGIVEVVPPGTIQGTYRYAWAARVYIQPVLFNVGDDLIYGEATATATAKFFRENCRITKLVSKTAGLNVSYSLTADGGCSATLALKISGGTVASGNTSSTEIDRVMGVIEVTYVSGGNTFTYDDYFTFYQETSYTSNKQQLWLQISDGIYWDALSVAFSYEAIRANSTISILGHPTYIDCDLGECYKIENGEYVSLNGKIALGSDLPTLASGENEATFDNTITELKIVPRWWKL